jgi:hypothetical protein
MGDESATEISPLAGKAPCEVTLCKLTALTLSLTRRAWSELAIIVVITDGARWLMNWRAHLHRALLLLLLLRLLRRG